MKNQNQGQWDDKLPGQITHTRLFLNTTTELLLFFQLTISIHLCKVGLRLTVLLFIMGRVLFQPTCSSLEMVYTRKCSLTWLLTFTMMICQILLALCVLGQQLNTLVKPCWTPQRQYTCNFKSCEVKVFKIIKLYFRFKED